MVTMNFRMVIHAFLFISGKIAKPNPPPPVQPAPVYAKPPAPAQPPIPHHHAPILMPPHAHPVPPPNCSIPHNLPTAAVPQFSGVSNMRHPQRNMMNNCPTNQNLSVSFERPPGMPTPGGTGEVNGAPSSLINATTPNFPVPPPAPKISPGECLIYSNM